MIRPLILIASLLPLAARAECEGVWVPKGEEEYKSPSGEFCSKPCGCGLRNMVYKITKQGDGCPNKEGETKVESCIIRKCGEPIYSDWTSCSEQCGEGFQSRTATYEDGNPVPEDEAEVLGWTLKQSCTLKPCCQLTNWTKGECSKTCGKGKRKLTRQQLADGAEDCGDLEKEEDCQEAECPIDSTAVLDTTCGGRPLPAEQLKDFGSKAKSDSCRKADTAECIQKCDDLKDCVAFEETHGVCCFFAELNGTETYAPGSATTCYKLRGIDAPESSIDIRMVVAVIAILLSGYLMTSQGPEREKAQPEIHGSPSRSSPLADVASSSPMPNAR